MPPVGILVWGGCAVVFMSPLLFWRGNLTIQYAHNHFTPPVTSRSRSLSLSLSLFLAYWYLTKHARGSCIMVRFVRSNTLASNTNTNAHTALPHSPLPISYYPGHVCLFILTCVPKKADPHALSDIRSQTISTGTTTLPQLCPPYLHLPHTHTLPAENTAGAGHSPAVQMRHYPPPPRLPHTRRKNYKRSDYPQTHTHTHTYILPHTYTHIQGNCPTHSHASRRAATGSNLCILLLRRTRALLPR